MGLYTSPHLVRYNERFRINGEEVSDEALCAAAARVKAAADTMEDAPTQFELLTCVGFCCFEAAACDIVVLEVGLGGRLDATNVIPAPEAAVITRIGLEHTELLGDTLEKIATEKAGIVKAGGTVVLGDHAEPVRRTVEEICRQRGARLIQAEEPAPLTRSLEGQRFAWGRYPEVRLSLLGSTSSKTPPRPWRCWRSCGSGSGPSRTRQSWRAWPMPCGRDGSSVPGPIPPSSWTAATTPSAPRRWPRLSRPISRERRSLS